MSLLFLLLFIFSGLLGLCVGSFLNVVIYRYGTGVSPYKGRSRCQVCNTHLRWFELIPLFSFLIQKGKCRTCGIKLSLQYPIVEFLTSILFMLAFVRQYNLYALYGLFPHGLLYSCLFLVFYFIIVSILLVITVYDFRHKIIPDGLVYSFIGLSVAKLLLFSFVCLGTSPFVFPHYMDLLAPIIFFIPFWFLWFISKGMWIGFGDAKLAFGIGALLGFVYGLSALVIGFWIGALVSIACMAIEKIKPHMFGNLNIKSEIPLAPFLVLGTLIEIFVHIDVFRIAVYFTS